MRCATCGQHFPSKFYFVLDGLCRSCFERLEVSRQQEILREVESQTTEAACPRTVAGNDLRCPVCGHDTFWKRRTLMNTPGMTFFGVEWANRQAENFVCDRCGHVLWFLREESPREPAMARGSTRTAAV